MKEDFLHYLWKFKKFDFLNAETTNGESLQLIRVGQHNEQQSGPDFFNAQLKIDEQFWAGNVEIHLKSSDWYVHHHQTDPAYDNVILHVVWEHDVAIYRRNNTPIPTMILKDKTADSALENYYQLLENKKYRWINCQSEFSGFSDFEIENWLERLYVERLEEKSKIIRDLLQQTAHDWEAVLFCMLAKNFGLNVNGEAFMSLALSTPFSVIRKLNEVSEMEALLFGQSGLLRKEEEVPYFLNLKAKYAYLKHKYRLDNQGVLPVYFFRLRPQNFPTIRLAQLSSLLISRGKLFSQLIEEKKMDKIRAVFTIEVSEFWRTHYTFGKESGRRPKKLSKSFVELLLINTVIPLKFCFFREKGKIIHEELFSLMRQLPREKNSIVRGFHKLRPETAENAMDSQAMLQLKKQYCDKNRCLQCALGLQLLQKK